MDHNKDVEMIQSYYTINDFCRLCANLNNNMVPIYTDEGADHMLENKIKTHLPFINISKNDLLPKTICYHCASAVLVWNKLYESSSEADLKLRSMFEASPFDRNNDKRRSRADIEEIITVPVNDFIGDTIDYEEISDVSVFNKNEKLDKTPSTPERVSILHHEIKPFVVIREDKRLKPTLKSENSAVMFGRVDDENLEDHNVFSDMVMGIDEKIKRHPLDVMSTENCAELISKRVYLVREDDQIDDGVDVERMVDKDVLLSNAVDNVHLNLQYQQQELQQQQYQEIQQQQSHLELQHQHQHGDEDYVSLKGAVYYGDTLASVNDDQNEFRSEISSFANGNDSRNDVNRLLKCMFDGEAVNSFDDDGSAASSVGNDYEDMQVDKSAVSDDCCSPIKVEVLDFEDSGDGQDERICWVCSIEFKTRYNLLRHFQKRHPEFKVYECDLCRICFRSIAELNGHLKQKHSKVQQTPHADETRFACDVCGYMFKKEAYAKIHQLTHTTAKTVHCSRCDYACYTKQQLIVHQAKHDKRFFCDVCHKRFAQKSQMNVHVKSVHYNQRPYACVICDKSFKTKGSHDAHMIVHADARNYQCPFCDKKCRKQYDLTLHIRTHTGEKPFKCSVCGRGFVQLCDTRKHEKAVHFKPGKKQNIILPVAAKCCSQQGDGCGGGA